MINNKENVEDEIIERQTIYVYIHIQYARILSDIKKYLRKQRQRYIRLSYTNQYY